MSERLLSLLTGYAFGNFMTAEIVTRRLTGKPCSELGKTGNPGMANVMANLGFRAGITVLAGDLGKCFLACLVSGLLFGNRIGQIAVYYAGVGCTLGHDWPVWMKPGRGGKGVAASCLAMFLYDPVWGAFANIFGMLVTFGSKYLCIGGAVLPASFILPAFLFHGKEAGILSVFLSAVCLWKHWPAIRTIPEGTCERTDVLSLIRKKLSAKSKPETEPENSTAAPMITARPSGAQLTTLCYLEKDGRYLMLHRTVKKHDVNKDKWIGVGGHFEACESPEECVLREVREETGFRLTSFRLRGIITFQSGKGDFEYMFLYTADAWEGEPVPCDEGELEWVELDKVWSLNLWEGDKIFFRLLDENRPFFSLKLVYDRNDILEAAILDGKPMELFDVLNEDGTKSGVVKERGVAHREGALHGTVHMWIVRPNDRSGYDLLLQKRSACKDSNPGDYDISSAGHRTAGSEALPSAMRELKEELGLSAPEEAFRCIGMHRAFFDGHFYGKDFHDRELATVYILKESDLKGELRLQEEEVESVRWMDFCELYDAVKNHTLPNCIYVSELDLIRGYLFGTDSGQDRDPAAAEC